MKVAIMQPYFFPYIGYFQLINAVDVFIVYDNIKYTKKGWINRNRILQNGSDVMFSLPLKKDSDYLNVDQRFLSPDFDRKKLLNKIKEAYRKAPYFEMGYNLIENSVLHDEDNLFEYIYYSLKDICRFLDISTEIKVSSSIDINHSLQSEEKVLAICENLGAETYINAIGGHNLYSQKKFSNYDIGLKFIQTNAIGYKQLNNDFVPGLSILDVIMFNDKEKIIAMLGRYELI